MNKNRMPDIRTILLAILVPAIAQPMDASAQQAELEEVTVTAQRRATDLQTTAVAVSSIGAEALERLQISTLGDLDAAVPSMAVEGNVASNAAITVSLRGNPEQNAAFMFSEPGVGLYANGVYRRLSGSNIELMDIERIEVMRGPQGTLFGRNTLAGAINIVTRAPSDTLGGSIELGYGDFDTTRARFSVSGPLSDQLRGSFAVMHKERGEGWMTNRVDDTNIGETKFFGAQGSLALSNESLDATLSVYTSSSESDGVYGNPFNVATGQPVFSDESDVAGASVPAGSPYNETDQSGADLVISVPLGSFTLKSITSYNDMEDDWAVDFTAAQMAAPPPAGLFDPVPGTSGFFRHAVSDQDQVSQEFSLTRDTGSTTSILGVYYYSETSEQTIQDYFAGGFFPGVPAYHRLESDSLALFGQVDFQIADRWRAIVGARYTSDDKDFFGNKGNAFFAPTDFSSSRSFDRFTGKLGLEFDVNENLFSYLTFSQGYKAGAFDPFANADLIAIGTDEELVDSLELGLKAELLERTLRLNTAVFITRYDDLVIGTITANGLVSRNAGESEVTGLEAELTWLANDRFRVFAAISLMDAEWRSLAPEALLTGVSLSDKPPYTFDVKYNLGATFDVPLSAGMLQLAASTRFIDDFFVQVAHGNNPLDRVDSRTWVDASVTYNSDDARHTVALKGKNLSDEQGQYGALNFSPFLFNNTASLLPGEPRTWEVNYAYSF